ncbi:hypothetical protein [Sphingomonas sp.]|jgi:hypothetical protein|uniref:hypothetical protein n=1 Tax=Sphingomonas sp. TaxID=28214 RepID=UPI002EDA9C58
MRLIELLRSASEWSDEDTTIYVAPEWSGNAEAILVTPAPDTTEPVVRDGRRYDYFLETFVAREVIEDYASTAEGAHATEEERCNRLIRYAQDDA